MLRILLLAVAAYSTGQPGTIRVAVVQMAEGPVIAQNRDRILSWIPRAAAERARVVVFPEAALRSGDDTRDAEVEQALGAIREAAHTHGLYVVFGGWTPAPRLGKNANWMRVVDPSGAEVFRYDNYQVEDRNDKAASHALDVRLAGGATGRIVTTFDEPYAARLGSYDVEVRYCDEPQHPSRFTLLINGVARGESWDSPGRGEGWTTRTVHDLEVRTGDEIAVLAHGTPGRLDYVQLNQRGSAADAISPAALVEKLRGGDVAARIEAARALTRTSDEAEAATAGLIAALTQDKPFDVRLASLVLFNDRPDPGADIEALSEALNDPDRQVRAAAAYTLAGLGPGARPALPRLIALLRDADHHPRNFAALAIAMLGPEGAEAVPALIEAAGRQEPALRYARATAVLALGMIGEPSAPAVPALDALLADPAGGGGRTSNTVDVRAAAAFALGQIGPPARPALPRLVAAASDASPLVRYFAVRSLVAIGAGDAAARGTLERARQDADESIRALTAQPAADRGLDRSLPGLAGEEIEAVRTALHAIGPKNQARGRDSASIGLGVLGQGEEISLPTLRDPGNPETTPRRHAAIAALGGINRDDVPILLEAVKRVDAAGLSGKVLSLGQTRGSADDRRRALEQLGGLLRDPRWFVRVSAARAIAALKQPAAPALEDQAADPGPQARAGLREQSFVYWRMGERTLQVVVNYPPGWSADERRPALLCFEGGVNNPKDKAGQRYPLAEERARRGLKAVNDGPGKAFRTLAEYFARRGLVTACVETRKRSTDGVLPDGAIEDAVHAVRWARQNAAMLGIDAHRVAVAGGSGGGHAAASLYALEHFHPAGPDASVSARPDAMLLYYPLLDWLGQCSMSERFLDALDNDRALAARLSPARYWKADAPPTLVLVGTRDPTYQIDVDFVASWKKQGAAIDIDVAEGAPHGFLNRSPWTAGSTARADAFLQTLGYLGADPAVPLPVGARKEQPAEP